MPASCATEIAETLDRSVRYALETMCFAEAFRATISVALPMRVQIPFRAGFTGTLDLAVTPTAARWLAAAVLGSPPGEIPPEPYVDDTVCELGTVICGHFLSSLDPYSALELQRARLLSEVPTSSAGLHLGFQLEQGELAVSLRLT